MKVNETRFFLRSIMKAMRSSKKSRKYTPVLQLVLIGLDVGELVLKLNVFRRKNKIDEGNRVGRTDNSYSS